MRASGESMLCASFIIRSASASISARTRIAIELDLVGVGVGLGLGADRRAAVGARVLLGARRARQAQRLALGDLARADQLDRLLALGHLDLARGEDLLLGGDGVGARRVGGRLGVALRLALLRDRDRALLLGELDRHPALDLGRLDRALLADPLLLDRLLGADARRVDRLLGGDLRALALLLALRALGHQLGALARARDLDLALLAAGARTRPRGRSRARASRPRGSCCGSRSACPARRRSSASCAARSSR